jgi:hypothetical protein
MPISIADGWTENASQEELHRWLIDSLQDLEQMRDVILARLSEVMEPEEDGRLLYALWLNRQALLSVEAMMHLFSFNKHFMIRDLCQDERTNTHT